MAVSQLTAVQPPRVARAWRARVAVVDVGAGAPAFAPVQPEVQSSVLEGQRLTVGAAGDAVVVAAAGAQSRQRPLQPLQLQLLPQRAWLPMIPTLRWSRGPSVGAARAVRAGLIAARAGVAGAAGVHVARAVAVAVRAAGGEAGASPSLLRWLGRLARLLQLQCLVAAPRPGLHPLLQPSPCQAAWTLCWTFPARSSSSRTWPQ